MKVSRKKSVDSKISVLSTLEGPKQVQNFKTVQGRRQVRVSNEMLPTSTKKGLKKVVSKRADNSRQSKKPGKLSCENSPPQLGRIRKDSLKSSKARKKPLFNSRHKRQQLRSSFVKKELTQLRKDLESRNHMIVELVERGIQNPGHIFKKIHEGLLKNNIGIYDLLRTISSGNTIEIKAFVSAIQEFGAHEERLCQLLPSSVPIEVLINLYEKYASGTNEVEEALKDLVIKMQTYRIPKDHMLQALFGDNDFGIYNQKKLGLLLENSPFSLKSPRVLAGFLVGSAGEASMNEICKNLLESIEDWAIFSSEQEKAFELEIYNFVIQRSQDILEDCQKHGDSVPVDTLFHILKQNGLDVRGNLELYIRRILYYYEIETDRIAYTNLVEAFCEPPETDEERILTVTRYLGVIARNILKRSLTIRDVFENIRGFVYPEAFMKGLKHIGIEDLEEDEIMMLIEALKFEGNCSRICLKIEDLEIVFRNYGIEIKQPEESGESVIVRNDSSIEQTYSLTFW